MLDTPQIPDESRINTLIRDCLLNLPTGDESVVSFLAITVVGDWVFPQRFEDTLLLEAVLHILQDHFFLLGPINQDNAEQLRINILSFLNEDDEFNKKIEKKINRLKLQSRLNPKLLEQFRDIVNSSEGIDFINSREQESLLRSSLGIYRENNKLFINRFYADHSLIVNFLKYISWESPKRKIKRKILDIWIFVKNPRPFTISITFIILAITSIVLDRRDDDSKFNQIVALCNAKQLDINCGDSGQKSNESIALIHQNNQKILGQIKSGKLNEKDVYPIAAVVPLSSPARYVADNMLGAIARKQKEYNKQDKSKLFVFIADDKNNIATGQDIAKKLGEIKILLGVVGPYSSSNSAGVIQNYRNNKLVLVSPTTTATLRDLNESYHIYINSQNNLDLDTSFFFRPVGTTEYQIRDVLQYLKDKNKTKVILFWDSGDTYSQSLKNQFDNQKRNLSIVPHDSNGVTAAKLGSTTKEIVSQPDIQKDSTTILIFQGAYKSEQEVDEPRKKAKDIIRANQGHFLVIGSNPVYRTDLMCDFINEPNIAQKISSDLLMMQPWFPGPEDDLYPKPINCDDKNPQDSFSPWQSAMSSDATQMLIYAINKASENGYPTREKIQEALMSDEIQDETCDDKNKGIKDNVLTGNITLNGSDRCNPSSELVRPIYLNDTKQWQWQKLPKSY
jgi:ABC-type branched-subunit amino acid transport system substrate-binding protein